MSGIPLALIFGVLTWLAWRRGWRGGALMLWAFLFGVCLDGSARDAVLHFVEHVTSSVASGASDMATDFRR
jgi:hypothetical protein